MINITPMFVTLDNSGAGYYDRAAICDHIMQGHMAGTFARFNNPAEEVSAHFGISSSGQIVQYVSMTRWAYANGIIETGWDQSLPWLVEAVNKGINPNKRTISIEHEGFPGDPLPEVQYQASLELHRFIMQNWPTILPDRKHIIGHYQISPQSRPNCPSGAFPFDRLIADLQKGVVMSDQQKVPGPFAVSDAFSRFWYQYGGLPVFGYPIGAGQDARGNFGQAKFIQYFERARFELQPDGSIMLGLVGNEALKYRGYQAR